MQWRFFHIGRICVPFAQKVAEIGLWTQVAKWSQGPLCVMGYVMTSGNEQNWKYNRLKFKNGGGGQILKYGPNKGPNFISDTTIIISEKNAFGWVYYVCKPECVSWPLGGLILHVFSEFIVWHKSCQTDFPYKIWPLICSKPPKTGIFKFWPVVPKVITYPITHSGPLTSFSHSCS